MKFCKFYNAEFDENDEGHGYRQPHKKMKLGYQLVCRVESGNKVHPDCHTLVCLIYNPDGRASAIRKV